MAFEIMLHISVTIFQGLLSLVTMSVRRARWLQRRQRKYWHPFKLIGKNVSKSHYCHISYSTYISSNKILCYGNKHLKPGKAFNHLLFPKFYYFMVEIERYFTTITIQLSCCILYQLPHRYIFLAKFDMFRRQAETSLSSSAKNLQKISFKVTYITLPPHKLHSQAK